MSLLLAYLLLKEALKTSFDHTTPRSCHSHTEPRLNPVSQDQTHHRLITAPIFVPRRNLLTVDMTHPADKRFLSHRTDTLQHLFAFFRSHVCSHRVAETERYQVQVSYTHYTSYRTCCGHILGICLGCTRQR